MNRKEVPRAGLVKAALGGRITTQQEATALRLSGRQFQRLKHRFRDGGARALLHRLPGLLAPRARGPRPEVGPDLHFATSLQLSTSSHRTLERSAE